MKGAELVAACLSAHGIKHVFGLPGTGNVELVDAIHREGIEFISVRHESGASFAADGYARASLSPGVCTSTRSGGSLNMSIGIQNAYQESSPVVALLGQVERYYRYAGSFEEMDLASAYETITKYCVEAQIADRVGYLVNRALFVSQVGRPAPTAVSIPIDVQMDETSVAVPSVDPVPIPGPEPGSLKKAAELLAKAEFPIIYVGGGVHWSRAHEELIRAAETLGCGVVTSWHRKAEFPNDNQLYLGMAGGGGAPVTSEVMGMADLILAVGCKFSQIATGNYKKISPDAKVIQLNTDSENLNRVYSPAVSILSDARLGLEGLLAEIERTGGVKKRDTRQKEVIKLHERLVRETEIPDVGTGKSGVHPAALLSAMKDAFPADAVMVMDSGAFAHWVLRYYPFTVPGTVIAPSGGAMGFGWPATIGVKLALPDTPVVCVSGDGGFAMTMSELETAVRYEVQATCIVMNNSAYANVLAKQDTRFGGRRVGTELGNVDFAAIAEAMGGTGIRVEQADELASAFKDASRQRGPSVVDVAVDPAEIHP